MRENDVKPIKEFSLRDNKRLKTSKHFYGLKNSREYCNVIHCKHLRQDLMMMPTAGYLSLLFGVINGNISRVPGTYVDESISTSTAASDNISLQAEERLECKPQKYNTFKFAGHEIVPH